MLDPSILVSHSSDHGVVNPVVADAQKAIAMAAEAESRARNTAAAIEFLAALDAANNLEDAAAHAAGLLRESVEASRVIILWRKESRKALSVIADSEQGVSEQGHSEYRLAASAGEEVAVRDAGTHWSAVESSEGTVSPHDRHAMMAVGQFAKELSASVVAGDRLVDATGRDRGAVLVIEPAQSWCAGFLAAVAPPLASRLVTIERLEPRAWESAIRGLIEMASGSRRHLFCGVAVALLVILCLPVRYRVSADLELQPVKHRFVAVPFDGPLEAAHVRPGDVVEEGDLLATINPREIEYELASIRADLNRALQEKKGLMAEHDSAGSKIAALESDRLRLQTELLQYRRDNLEIRSPIAGVVVSGDLKESEGTPVTRGETLFEIAPLGEMVVEIGVAEADVSHVRPGMPVEFYVHSLPHRTMGGTIDRVHPRAELRDHDNVFIAEVQIEDPENVLRPGMRGRAKIFSDRHTLGWNVFHKACYALLRAMGW